MSTIEELAKAERDRRGISLREMAKETGVSFSALARVEREGSCFNFQSARRIRRWLDGEAADEADDRVSRLERRVEQLERIIAAMGASPAHDAEGGGSRPTRGTEQRSEP